MRFQYDEQKDHKNLARHDVDFETAALVFDDPYAVTIRDTAHDEEEDRYITIGEIGPGAILFVVHTWFADKKGEEVIRLISARTATSKERKHYEEAYKKPETSNRRRRREKGRRH
jgi:uncharacterized DUF497 family protein